MTSSSTFFMGLKVRYNWMQIVALLILHHGIGVLLVTIKSGRIPLPKGARFHNINFRDATSRFRANEEDAPQLLLDKPPPS